MTSASVKSTRSPRPARMSVKRRLLRQIGQMYHPGDRLPSVRDLSKMLDVAHNTAYEAVRELADEGVIELRPRLGAFVAAPATANSQKLAADAADVDLSSLCVAAYFHLRDHFIVDMFEHFQACAVEVGMRVRTRVNPEAHVTLDSDCHAGVMFNAAIDGSVQSRPDQAVALVTTAQEIPPVQTARVDVVSVDQVQGGRLAGLAMGQAGVDDAFFVGVADYFANGAPPRMRGTCVARLEGFEAGFGKPVSLRHQSLQFAYGIPLGIAAAEQYLALASRPAGVFCATDDLAVGFVRRLTAAGLRPGVDYQLIGFDGQSRSNEALGLTLATVRVPAADMGRQAFELLANRVNHPAQPQRRLLLGCSLRPGCTLASPLSTAVSATDSTHTSHESKEPSHV